MFSLVPGLVAAAVCYACYQAAAPFLAIRTHLREARAVGLPVKILPVPQGLFSFFAFQLVTKLGLVRDGSWLHRVLNAGRPDGHAAHKDLGDVFLTVNPMGITLVVADPALASYVSARREQFPKPPNTGAAINIYGRNVINTRGETYRFHRRVTGPVFSERIHARVWDEAARQVSLMKQSWKDDGLSADPGRDALRLGLNVITGAAYGCELGWNESPPTVVPPGKEGGGVNFSDAVEDLTTHLMPIFLTPKWWLRIAPANSVAGQARAAHTAFGGYMKGMLEAERRRMADGEAAENLLTAILDAHEHADKDGRRMSDEEVLGNAFIFLFAGHETTANTFHYALLQLAAHPDAQAAVHVEIDALRAAAAREGRALSYTDFPRARWLTAVMQETLRIYTPTSMVHKWTDVPAPVAVGGATYTIPAKTRISVNCTGVHMNPNVWGEDADVWRPQRWIVPAGSNAIVSPALSSLPSSQSFSSQMAATPTSATLPSPPSIMINRAPTILAKGGDLLTPPTTPLTNAFGFDSPSSSVDYNLRRASDASLDSTLTAAESTTTAVDSCAGSPTHKLSPLPSPTAFRFPLLTPPGSVDFSAAAAGPWDVVDVLRPAKGAFLPFSEGSRACSGRKFASVEFVSAMCALLGDREVRLGDGWTPERLLQSLRGRKPGALTLQPPEIVPLIFTAR